MIKRSLFAFMAFSLAMVSCKKDVLEEQMRLDNTNEQKTVINYVLSDSIKAAYPVLKDDIKNAKPLPNGFKVDENAVGALVGGRLGHGSCSQQKGLCAMDTLYSPVPVDIYTQSYTIGYVQPTLDTLYPGTVYVLSDNQLIYFPKDHMHLTDGTVPISENINVHNDIATALGFSGIEIKDGLYKLHTNLYIPQMGYNGYAILDCTTW